MLPDGDRGAYFEAMLGFLFYGEEPEGLPAGAAAVFCAIRPVLEKTRARSSAGRAGGQGKREANPKQTRSKPEANAKQTESKPKANPKHDAVLLRQNGGSYQDSSSLSYSHSGEGVQGEGDGAEPPTADAVRAYFGANCLNGDPDEFLDFYAAQGWRRSNGLPVEDWEAQARIWSRRQVDLDAKAPAPPPRPPADDYDDPDQLARWERELAAIRGGEA